jgi:hypothetical protein
MIGAGLIIAPPTRTKGGAYEIIKGTLDDLDRLPPMFAEAPKSERAQVQEGGRNNALWRHCMRRAHHCDTFDALLDAARTVNDQISLPPLSDTEVVKITRSAWSYTERGHNRFGQHGAWFPIEEVNRLIGDQDRFYLLAFLRAHNAPNAQFFITNSPSKTLGWPVKRLQATRHRMLRLGEVRMVKSATKGNPAEYRWALGGQN